MRVATVRTVAHSMRERWGGTHRVTGSSFRCKNRYYDSLFAWTDVTLGVGHRFLSRINQELQYCLDPINNPTNYERITSRAFGQSNNEMRASGVEDEKIEGAENGWQHTVIKTRGDTRWSCVETQEECLTLHLCRPTARRHTSFVLTNNTATVHDYQSQVWLDKPQKTLTSRTIQTSRDWNSGAFLFPSNGSWSVLNSVVWRCS